MSDLESLVRERLEMPIEEYTTDQVVDYLLNDVLKDFNRYWHDHRTKGVAAYDLMTEARKPGTTPERYDELAEEVKAIWDRGKPG